MESKLFKIFISLGVPGLALGVFYMLFKTFNWTFPIVPANWVGPIIVIFMLLTFAIIFYALTLWRPLSPIIEKRTIPSREEKTTVEVASMKNTDIQACFTRPTEGNRVSPTIVCEGQVQPKPNFGELWLTIKIGDMMWLKPPTVNPNTNGSWSATIYEGGSPEIFSVVLWFFPTGLDASLRDWLKRGQQTGDYPPLYSMPGGKRLTAVDELRLT
jgi:hypothetical protein